MENIQIQANRRTKLIKKMELHGLWLYLVHQLFPKKHAPTKIQKKETTPPFFRDIPREKCIGCGLCFSVCKSNAIQMAEDESGFIPTLNTKACTNCNLCSKVCPGVNVVSYPGLLGNVNKYVVSTARDQTVRYSASSGGAVRSILISLLEKKIVDKVIITRATDDPYHPETIITDSIADLSTERLNSIYSPTSPLAALKNLDKTLTYAFVGLPCHIAGIQNAPSIKKHIKVTIGIFCSHTPSFQFLNTFFKDISAEKDIQRVYFRGDGWPGRTQLMYKDGQKDTIHFTAMWHTYNYAKAFQQKRCSTCSYYSAEFADISVGDPWILAKKDSVGSSLIFIRTQQGEEAVAAATERITMEEITGPKLESILKFHKNSAASKQGNT